MVFYDANGNIQSTAVDSNYCFEPNTTIALEFSSRNTSTYKLQPYAKFKLNMGNVYESYHTGYLRKIKVSPSPTDGKIIAEVTNNSGKKLNFINLAVIFYDASGKVIGYDDTYADCTAIGDVDYTNIYYPYDANYNKITPASYRVYVNYAY